MGKRVRYQQEFLASVYIEIQQLLDLHWQDIALNQDKIKLNPDWDRYEEAEKRDELKIFTARQDEKLVGYFVCLVQVSLHYKDHKFAHNDVLYLHPDYRKGLAGWRLMKFAQNCLSEDDVSLLMVNTKIHKPFDVLLKRLGYNHVENVYSKVLN